MRPKILTGCLLALTEILAVENLFVLVTNVRTCVTEPVSVAALTGPAVYLSPTLPSDFFANFTSG